MSQNRKKGRSRPIIYGYHDYREFLKDLVEFLGERDKTVSLRKVSSNAGLAVSYLALVLRGERSLSEKAIEKLAPVLHLSPPEKSYLKLICVVGDTEDADERLDALKKAQRFKGYRESNQNEMEAYKYLTGWYYVAIREMTGLPDFQADSKWIQARLKKKVSLKEIDEALNFLTEKGYIRFDQDGNVIRPEKHIDCIGGVFRLALTRFHRDMFSLASESIETTSRDKRIIDANTFTVNDNQLRKVKQVLDRAMEEIVDIAAEKSKTPAENVYHVGFTAFPLTKKAGGQE